MGPINGRVLENAPVTADCRRLEIGFREDVDARPGQFFQVEAGGAGSRDPFLRRPLSIASLEEKRALFYYKLRGRGTKLLAGLSPGADISLLGPLGQGYRTGRGRLVLVGGGIGAASLFFLASRFSAREKAGASVLLGARTAPDLFFLPRFQALGLSVACATDDGTGGCSGSVTALATRELNDGRGPGTMFACGPPLMLRELYRVMSPLGWKIQVSLETMMACGFGVCRGCVVPTVNGYRSSCSDGPVFDGAVIRWDEYVENC